MRHQAATLALLLAFTVAPTSAHAKGVEVLLDFIDVSKAPVFRVYVDYLNEAGRPIRGLEPKDINLLVDGETWEDPVQVTPFAKGGEGVAYVLLASTYRGFSMAFDTQKRGLSEFVSAMGPKDVAAIYSYSDNVNPLVDFTSDKEELQAALRGLQPSDKPVNVFLDAVIAGLEAFPAQDPAFPRRRGIVMMADGLDQNLADQRGIVSRVKNDLAPKARALGVKFYSLGYTIESQQGLRIMKTLQKKFGGTFRHVRDTELQRANQFFRDISERVAGQYIVQFETDDLDSEETHTLQINVNHQGKPIESVPTEFQPPPVEGTPWWVWLLRIGGALLGLFILIAIIMAIVNREPSDDGPAQEFEEGACELCGASFGLLCEDCPAERLPGRFPAKLVLQGGRWSGKYYPVIGESVTIGREADVPLLDDSVSGRHASIRIDEMKFELADLNSTNGTFVNGKRVSKQFLKSGDLVRCGNVEMRFELA